MNQEYALAKAKYESIGIDTDAVIENLKKVPVSMHCWQGDDVGGFDFDGALSGGIQTTGNYPGKARTPDELMADIDKVLSLDGGAHKLNLHACYAIFEKGEYADRDAIEPKHFAKWVEFAKERGMGIDFNPTFFSHPKANGLTLSSPDEEIRKFWVRHGQACLRIAEYFANETGIPCVMNIWIPDGYKDIPADRYSPRARFAKSLDEILDIGYDREKVLVCLESKVFGIGLESYTVGSAEFGLGYVLSRGIVPLMDNGHYHPTEVVSDKISSMLLFSKKLALHVTRSVRWDSDHVIRLDDETKEIAKEIVASGRIDDIAIALDYFDASINRVAAWTIGLRNFRKALLIAMLTPHEQLKALQNEGNYTELMMRDEELKSYPWGAVWNEYCERCGVAVGESFYDDIVKYEKEVLSKRV
ncbi:MAG: L-rhamnose isomerase [Ruminococcaceae bacterium]|nr:L-rhamnose isomerase [Oscillospiraceae bacterium]